MIELGNHSYACEPEFRGNMSKVIVGNYTSIARGVIFDCGFQHNIKNTTSFPLHKIWPDLPSNVHTNGDIIIGSDVTIGENCIIMSGVNIGSGAVIGAGTVVRKNVYAYTIEKGQENYGYRFKSQGFNYNYIDKLLEIAWWNWPDERVLANANLLLSEDIDNFIENYV